MEIVDENQVHHPDKSIYEKYFHSTKYSIRLSEPNYFYISAMKIEVYEFKRSSWSSLFLIHMNLPNVEGFNSSSVLEESGYLLPSPLLPTIHPVC